MLNSVRRDSGVMLVGSDKQRNRLVAKGGGMVNSEKSEHEPVPRTNRLDNADNPTCVATSLWKISRPDSMTWETSVG